MFICKDHSEKWGRDTGCPYCRERTLQATIAEQKDSIEGGVLVATALNSRINLLEQSALAQKSALGELRATKAERDALVEAAREAVDAVRFQKPEHERAAIDALAAILDATLEQRVKNNALE